MENKIEETPKKKIKFRYVFMLIGAILVTASLFLSEYDVGLVQNLPFGASTITYLIFISTPILGVGLLYLSKIANFDYVNFKKVFEKCAEDRTSLAIWFVGASIQILAIAVVINAFMK